MAATATKIPYFLANISQYPQIITALLKGIVSKLTIKFWMCKKCGKMKNYDKKMTTSAVE
jgi:hypothetical protein